MIQFGTVLDILKKTTITVVVIKPNVFRIQIRGHPTDCINSAHKIFMSHFKQPWSMTSITAISPKNCQPPLDRWLFDIVARVIQHD